MNVNKAVLHKNHGIISRVMFREIMWQEICDVFVELPFSFNFSFLSVHVQMTIPYPKNSETIFCENMDLTSCKSS